MRICGGGGGVIAGGVYIHTPSLYMQETFLISIFIFFGGLFNMVSIFLFSFSLNKNRSMCKAITIYN